MLLSQLTREVTNTPSNPIYSGFSNWGRKAALPLYSDARSLACVFSCVHTKSSSDVKKAGQAPEG